MAASMLVECFVTKLRGKLQLEAAGYGHIVEITHKDGWRTLYAHNSEIFAWEGQRVQRGDCIATVGESGNATGPHLHWEIRDQHGYPVDPSKHVRLS